MLELPGAHGALNLAERYWRLERWLRKWEARLHSSVGVTGAIYAMRRELWKPLPANLILDDVYLPMRLVLDGWRVGFTDQARARDVRRFEAGQEYRRKVRTLTGVIQVCAWLPGVLNPVRNPIWLQFVFHKLLRLLTPYLVVIALVGMAWAAVSDVAFDHARRAASSRARRGRCHAVPHTARPANGEAPDRVGRGDADLHRGGHGEWRAWPVGRVAVMVMSFPIGLRAGRA